MKAIVESLSAQIENWGMVWFGLIFLGSIFNELSLFNSLNISAFNINLLPYLFGLMFGLVAKYRGRWI
ncbi:MAG: hypothetical protein ACJ0F2_01380 [Gammaproteobacteria bacterium]|jgi:hypothetical protein|tara:strand:+ start:187 stop:390 length:204 start_codon:yes stop_codon:yes gene_type:complete